jgi:putative transposon-encoded protein
MKRKVTELRSGAKADCPKKLLGRKTCLIIEKDDD